MKIIYFLLLSFIISSCCTQADPEKELTDIMYDLSARNGYLNKLLSEMHDELYASPSYKISDDIAIEIYCGPRYILKIRQNKLGQTMIHGEIRGDVVSPIVEYFALNMNINDPSNHAPMYSKLTKDQAKENLNRSVKELHEVRTTPNVIPEMIEFKEQILYRWQDKYKVFTTLGIDTIREPHSQARVALDYQDKSLSRPVIDSIVYAHYQLREIVCRKYLKESYLKLYTRYSLYDTQIDRDKLDAISILMPIRVMDLPYCRENHIWTGEYHEPPPPPLEEIGR